MNRWAINGHPYGTVNQLLTEFTVLSWRICGFAPASYSACDSLSSTIRIFPITAFAFGKPFQRGGEPFISCRLGLCLGNPFDVFLLWLYRKASKAAFAFEFVSRAVASSSGTINSFRSAAGFLAVLTPFSFSSTACRMRSRMINSWIDCRHDDNVLQNEVPCK